MERRYSKGFAVPVLLGDRQYAGWRTGDILSTNYFLPGAVPTDLDAAEPLPELRAAIPTLRKHQIRWNWIADLPFGRGKKFGGNATGWWTS